MAQLVKTMQVSWRKWTWFALIVHLLAIFPFLLLIYDALTNNLTINPIQEATIRTGRYALYLLLLSLACTPLNNLFGWREPLKLRRALGLYAFGYAAVHVFIYAVVDFGLQWEWLLENTFQKPFTLVGFTAFTILLLLAITSFRWWMKRLGKNWKRLHRFVYLAGALAILHYGWAVKGDLLTLQGETIRPFFFGLVLILLLLTRLPVVKRTAQSYRAKMRR
jgi:methionine sulfoxide reductase heme-binding subunit